MSTRRTFIAQAGIVSAGMVIIPNLLMAKATDKAGLQLYSLRDQLPKDVKGTIAKVAIAGYNEVETFGYSRDNGFWGLTPKEFSKLLTDNGLTACSGHFDMNLFFGTGQTDQLKDYIDAAQATGMEYIVVPSIREEFIKTVDDFKGVADKLNKAGEIVAASGLKLGYHNHNFEWKPVDGTTFYDTILNLTDPASVHMEMDLYWVVRSEQDPVAIIKAHAGRYFAFHIKDMDKTTPKLNTEIGNGSIDFKTIMGYAKLAGVKHFIVEQENYTNIDPYTSITKSCRYLKDTLHV